MKINTQILTITFLLIFLSSCSTEKFSASRKLNFNYKETEAKIEKEDSKLTNGNANGEEANDIVNIPNSINTNEIIKDNNVPSEKSSIKFENKIETNDNLNDTALNNEKLNFNSSIKKAYDESKKIQNKLKLNNESGGGKMHWGAITGFIVGIVSLFVYPLFLGILALIFSAVALAKISKGEGFKGKGLAITGLILGIIGIIYGILLLA